MQRSAALVAAEGVREGAAVAAVAAGQEAAGEQEVISGGPFRAEILPEQAEEPGPAGVLVVMVLVAAAPEARGVEAEALAIQQMYLGMVVAGAVVARFQHPGVVLVLVVLGAVVEVRPEIPEALVIRVPLELPLLIILFLLFQAVLTPLQCPQMDKL